MAEEFFRFHGSPELKKQALFQVLDCQACPGYWNKCSLGAAVDSGQQQLQAYHIHLKSVALWYESWSTRSTQPAGSFFLEPAAAYTWNILNLLPRSGVF